MKALSRSPVNRTRWGFTVTDLCVLLAICGLLFALVLPAVAIRTGEQANRLKCASNLRTIAQASLIYAADGQNNGKFSRTTFNPPTVDSPQFYTGVNSPSAFAADGPPADGPQANDVTAALFHLLKSMDLTSDTFICPDTDAVRFPPDFALVAKSNFPGPQHLSYSYNNPYTSKAVIQAGWRFDSSLTADYPLAADINPGDRGSGGPTKVAYTAEKRKMRTTNSPNHWFEGQQVVYVDAHVEWNNTPFCGALIAGVPYRDNIYANTVNVDRTTGQGGIIHGPAQHAQDSVLLPTAQDTAAGTTIPFAVRTPEQVPALDQSVSVTAIIAAIVALLVLILVVAVIVSRKKPDAA